MQPQLQFRYTDLDYQALQQLINCLTPQQQAQMLVELLMTNNHNTTHYNNYEEPLLNNDFRIEENSFLNTSCCTLPQQSLVSPQTNSYLSNIQESAIHCSNTFSSNIITNPPSNNLSELSPPLFQTGLNDETPQINNNNDRYPSSPNNSTSSMFLLSSPNSRSRSSSCGGSRSVGSGLISNKRRRSRRNTKTNNLEMNSMLFTLVSTTFCNDTIDTMKAKCNHVKRGVGRPRKLK